MKHRPLGKRQMSILRYMSKNFGITTAMAYRLGKGRYALHSLVGNELIAMLNCPRRWHFTVAGGQAAHLGYWVDNG